MELTRAPVIMARLAPWQIGARGWVGILARSVDGAVQRDFGVAASSIAFAAFLSVLPLLSLVILVYGMFAPADAVEHNITTLVAILPGEARQLVHRWLTNSLTRHEGGGLALLLSAAITLFSARRAGQSLLYGIHLASDIPQDRGLWARLLVAMVVVFAGATLLLTALISVSALTVIEALVPSGMPGAKLGFTLLFWGSLTLGPAAALVLVYRYAAGRHPIPWIWTLPGTATALVLWITATLLFRLYVSHFARYGTTYGSLSAVIVLLLWLMLSAYAVLLGAKVNSEAMRTANVCRPEVVLAPAGGRVAGGGAPPADVPAG